VEKCRYGRESPIKYYDYDKLAEVYYECPHEQDGGRYCKFHDPHYRKENPEDLLKSFARFLNTSIRENIALLCIGYNLNKLQLVDAEFSNNAYFLNADLIEFSVSNSRLKGVIDFSNARFGKMTNFDRVLFEKEARFANTIFKKSANFTSNTFRQIAVIK
jgi:hypothetical protein